MTLTQSRWDLDATSAAVDHMNRIAAANDTKVPVKIVRHYATIFDVSERTVWNWLSNDPPKPRRSTPLPYEVRMLVATHHGQLKKAHRAATDQGIYDKTYSQFCREFKKLPPAEQAGLRGGVPAMIGRGLYLKQPVMSRLDLVMFDHTEADIYLRRLYQNRFEQFRPWLSLLIDHSSRFILGWVVTEGDGIGGDPATESIIALMAQAIRGFEAADGTFVGGKPRLVQSDNALAHSANAMVEGFLHLGIASRATDPGSPWQDGVVEALMETMSSECLAGQVGYTATLETRYPRPAWDVEDLLTMPEFLDLFEQWVDHYNFERFHSALRSTPFEAWRNDPVPVERVDDAHLRHAFLGSTRKSHRVSKNGVRFRNVDYTSPALREFVGADVNVRHLPNDRSFIHVYDGAVFICEAVPHSRLSEEDRIRLVGDRRREQQRVNHKIKTSRKRQVERRKDFADGLAPERDPNLPAHLHDDTSDRDDLLNAGLASLNSDNEETP